MATDKIKRNFVWLRKVLGIIDKTTLPGEVLGDVRPTMDLFGWDRLADVPEFASPFTAAPGTITTGPVTPEGFLRCYKHVAVRHTDTGVSHFLWIEKGLPGAVFVGLTAPNIEVPPLVPQAAPKWILVEPGAFLRGRTDIALVAGAIAMDMSFFDLPIGEYIPG